MPKPPMTPDDINALSKAWNESKAATDAVLAKFREGASKDEIDDAIRAAEGHFNSHAFHAGARRVGR